MKSHPDHPEISSSAPDNADLTISSLQNERVKEVVKLRRRANRDERQLLIIEGYRELKRALDNHLLPVSLFYCPDFFLGHNEPALIRQCRETGADCCQCTPVVFRKMAYRDRPEGLLAVAPQVKRTLADLNLHNAPLILAAESIEKPGNLGTLLRSADAAGADAVIVCDPCTDIYNPNVVRASIGALFTLPVIQASSREAIDWLRARDIRILSATPHAELDYTEADLTPGIAIVVGAEQVGLSSLWISAADMKVRIPMRGQADSLNVAAAATILLFETLRQRQGK
ncbi:MAG: RNA methyltransferase [Verrucomicrobia bacterium]|nr:RNA methyltransferase [Verrucomicrobiota bacterium]MBU4291891.1 RNA methyltransferase [Verrucomicrobiota bacterium]MBU4429808.1 RNA methyltransferase [Verrucomicrobiota bacterium]MCG2680285.1 RNA methyltransferase [Kiritimatiellia bacterium]